MTAPPQVQQETKRGLNAVSLEGRLAAPAEIRDLPSGDTVLVWRMIVPRTAPRSAAATIDTIDCASFDPRIIKRGPGWVEGSWLQAEGQLRRRFWKSPAGLRSRYEVEIVSARVVAKAPSAV